MRCRRAVLEQLLQPWRVVRSVTVNSLAEQHRARVRSRQARLAMITAAAWVVGLLGCGSRVEDPTPGGGSGSAGQASSSGQSGQAGIGGSAGSAAGAAGAGGSPLTGDGAPCTSDGQCESSKCYAKRFCTRTCIGPSDCPAGTRCVSPTSGPGCPEAPKAPFYCFPLCGDICGGKCALLSQPDGISCSTTCY